MSFICRGPKSDCQFFTTTGLPFDRRLIDVSTWLMVPRRKERNTPPAKRVAPDSVKCEAVDASKGLRWASTRRWGPKTSCKWGHVWMEPL